LILNSNELFSPTQIKKAFNGNRKIYMEFAPDYNLKPYIFCYWISPFELGRHNILIEQKENKELIVPDGCIDILFRIDRITKKLQTLVVGMMDSPGDVFFDYERIQTFGIRFYPGVLYPLLKYPINDFTNKIILLDVVIEDIRVKLGEVLIRASTTDEMISAANKYFSILVSDTLQNDTLNNALLYIYKAKGNLTVNEISRREVISERQIRRIFNNWIGINPKTFCKIIRFQNILKTVMVTKEVDWIKIALECGYYDQTHFINEFKEFCGSTPEKFYNK
jgi:AraC-like DNA-binding protein